MRTLFSIACISLLAKHDAHKGGGSAPPVDAPIPVEGQVPDETLRPSQTVPSADIAKAAEDAKTKVDGDTGEITGMEVGEVKMLKKLVAKDIVGRPALTYKKTFAEEDKEQKYPLPMQPRRLYLIFGQARDVKTGTSDYGPFEEFLGQFEAIVIETGERSVSARCFLQEPAQTMLSEQMAKRENKTDMVAFSFEVGVKPSQKWIDTDAGNSYEFTIKAHFELDKADPLAAMRQRLAHVVKKALPAPTK